ncbi:hypothetical protein LAZ67_20002366 [Cordylochernes scorpioides]|uniref:Retrotransposon gag domain-containing protein n=1 Tax=Cordylochernes scorpioides TaxID=51811 RepID=A0ABY6LN25_9ARAC|nr:hypothetical protein LAZ67_20002366 [Cordylochernes scorpioides]
MLAMPHPPYSPDLAPNDFFLFPRMKCCDIGDICHIAVIFSRGDVEDVTLVFWYTDLFIVVLESILADTAIGNTLLATDLGVAGQTSWVGSTGHPDLILLAICQTFLVINIVDIVKLASGFHRHVKSKTSFRDDDVPIDETTTKPLFTPMVETRSGKMQDPAQERIMAEESAKPQPGATIGRDASSDPVVLNPNIDIPKYDGTEDPRPWIESLEEIGFLYHWADYIISRYAAMNMTGSAKTWLNLHKTSFTSWENIKIRLIQDFSLDANKEELRMKLNRMQHWNEPAIRFAEDILVLCNKVDPAIEEETKIEHVIGGLKKEYSFAL